MIVSLFNLVKDATNAIHVDWKDVFVSSIPDGYIAATPYIEPYIQTKLNELISLNTALTTRVAALEKFHPELKDASDEVKKKNGYLGECTFSSLAQYTLVSTITNDIAVGNIIYNTALYSGGVLSGYHIQLAVGYYKITSVQYFNRTNYEISNTNQGNGFVVYMNNTPYIKYLGESYMVTA